LLKHKFCGINSFYMKDFKRAALLVEGATDIFHAKTASALIRYRTRDIAYLIDSTHSKENPNIFSKEINVPVIKSITEVAKQADALIICLVLPDGKSPKKWLDEITGALKNGVDVINPHHINFGRMKEIADVLGGVSSDSNDAVTKFNKTKAVIENIRAVPTDLELLSMKVLNTKAKRILTVGSDCNIGKMLTTLELNAAAQKKGINSSFVATGQVGILIKGSGIAIDRVISDFLSGAVERLIMEEQDKDVLFIEGQGSIFSPLYSAVTLGLIHGSAPDKMILCHVPTRKKLRYTDIDIPDMGKMIRMHEEIASIVNKCKVVGVALNCHDLSNEDAKIVIKNVEAKTGLPATDPVKFGVEKLLNACI